MTRRAAWLLLLALPALAQERPQPDPLDHAVAPGKVALGRKPEVGWRATQVSSAGGQALTVEWAIVGETAEAWRIEHRNPTLPEGAVMGLVVRKKDGAVTAAVAGKPGEKGRPIRIAEAEARRPEAAPEESEETVEVKGGKYRAKRLHDPAAKATTWVGLEGALREVVLKVEGGMVAYELEAPPETVRAAAGGEAIRLRYSNGMTVELVEDPIVAALFPLGSTGRGLLATRGKEYAIEVTATGKDAKPTLKWE